MFLIIIGNGILFCKSVNFCCDHGILRAALPANATRLIQVLDVAVFKSFKTIVRKRLQHRMYETTDPTLFKMVAIEIVCDASWCGR